MAYQPDTGEVFYCGKCQRQQLPSQGIKCTECGKITVSWYTNVEKAADALRKWKNVNGKS